MKYFCGATLLFAVAFFLVTDLTHAKDAMTKPEEASISASVHLPQLLSYDKLMTLKPEQRADYLKAVREILADVAKISARKKEKLISLEFEEAQEQFALLNSLVPMANAASSVEELTKVVPRFKSEGWKSQTWTCDAPGGAVTMSTDFGTCIRNRLKDGESCEPGFHEARLSRGGGKVSRACVPAASWDALSGERRQQLSSAEGGADVSRLFAKGQKEQATAVVLGSVIDLPAAEEPLSLEADFARIRKNAELSKLTPRFKDEGWKTQTWTCDGPGGAVTMNTEFGTCIRNLLKANESCDEGFHEARLSRGGGKVSRSCVPAASWEALSEERRRQLSSAEGGPNVADAFLRGKKDEAQAIALGGMGKAESGPVGDPAADLQAQAAAIAAQKCAPPKFTCEGDLKSRRKAFYDDKTADGCIFAGSMSQYKDGKKKVGGCEPVRKFELPQSGISVSCKGWGNTLCEPLLHSVGEDGNPYCVPAKGNALKACEAEVAKRPAKKDFLNQDTPGIKEKWNEFRTKFNKLCRDSATSRNFFCEECQMISDRLFTLNRVYSSPDRCGEAIDGEELTWRLPPNKAPAKGAGKSD